MTTFFKKKWDNIQINPKILWKEINGEMVVIDEETGEYHIFNNTGNYVWFKLSEGVQFDELALLMTKDYNINIQKATEDLKVLIEKLLNQNLIIFKSRLQKGEDDETKSEQKKRSSKTGE